VLVSTVGGYLLLRQYDGQVERIPRVFPEEQRPEPAPRDPRTILVVGSDSRGDLAAGEGTQGTGEEFVTGQRSDTMILVHLYGDSDQAQLVSLPRDSWVTIPAHTDPATGAPVPAAEAKLNAAFLQGGPALLVRTVEALSGLRIDHYAQVDFDGFVELVDALGGVEVCLSEPAQDEVSGIDLPAGRQTVRGSQALAFVRQRQGLPRQDIDRIARQQAFLGAVVRKALSTGTLANPLRLDRVLDVATSALQVDDRTSLDELRELVLRFRTARGEGITFATLPYSDIDGRRDGQSVVLLDRPAVDALFASLRDDVPPDPAATSAPAPLLVAAEDVRVRVLDTSGVPGLGRRVADELAAAGFQVVAGPLAVGAGTARTTVRHGPEKADSARTLAAAVAGARLEPVQSLGTVLDLVVGADSTGARPVAVPPGAPAAAPAASPAARTAAEDPCVV
jgi:LCP family protein required for cell wall assembly